MHFQWIHLQRDREIMKILSVVGTRPNFVKMAPVIREIQDREIDHVLVHTGQHYDREMSQIFLQELKMQDVDHFLDVGSGTHGFQTGNMLARLENVIQKEKPDAVMIPGDTNTSLAGALSSTKIRGMSTCHIESGLRSFDRTMPEEINRILIDHCSDFLFCPTQTAIDNLVTEGISDKRIFLVGDTMVQACLDHLELALAAGYSEKYHDLEDYYLVTAHRAENTDSENRLKGIVNALSHLDRKVIFPIHPRTKKQLDKFGLWDILNGSDNVVIIDPVGYLEFLFLLSKAKLMITDSGGIQKEAFLLKVPCVTLRDNTEWIETLSLNANVLVGAEEPKILEGIDKMLKTQIDFESEPFGDRKAAERIVDFVLKGKVEWT
jgi:UDP-N-acetylglucosamine 2-epimerase (non-hydrolysing)